MALIKTEFRSKTPVKMINKPENVTYSTQLRCELAKLLHISIHTQK